MQHRLYGLRGEAYISARNALFHQLKHDIIKDHSEIVASNKKFTAMDIGFLCNKYLIPVSVMCDWLYDLSLMSYDWRHLKDRGLKAKNIGVFWS